MLRFKIKQYSKESEAIACVAGACVVSSARMGNAKGAKRPREGNAWPSGDLALFKNRTFLEKKNTQASETKETSCEKTMTVT